MIYDEDTEALLDALKGLSKTLDEIIVEQKENEK